jgi:hypothetical protein
MQISNTQQPTRNIPRSKVSSMASVGLQCVYNKDYSPHLLACVASIPLAHQFKRRRAARLAYPADMGLQQRAQVVRQRGFAVPTEDYIDSQAGQVPTLGAGGMSLAFLDATTDALQFLSSAWLIDAPITQEDVSNDATVRSRLHMQIGNTSFGGGTVSRSIARLAAAQVGAGLLLCCLCAVLPCMSSSCMQLNLHS